MLQRYNLPAIVTFYHRDRTREMPGIYPYGTFKAYMEEVVEIWERPTQSMLEDKAQMILDSMRKLVLNILDRLMQ